MWLKEGRIDKQNKEDLARCMKTKIEKKLKKWRAFEKKIQPSSENYLIDRDSSIK